MHLPNHPDAAYEYVKALQGMRLPMAAGAGAHGRDAGGTRPRLQAPAAPAAGAQLRPARRCRSSPSSRRKARTPSSSPRCSRTTRPRGLQRREVGGVSIPPLVTQIGDGENGGVMMNEFPSGYRQAIRRFGTEGVVNVNVTEYLELIEQAGVKERDAAALPADPPGRGVRPHHEMGAGGRGQGASPRSSARSRTSPWTAARGPTTSAG